MDYVLTADALSKHYGSFKALDGLTMRVPKGSIYGFVGRNGAGKTTLIRLICGLQKPTAGRFTLYGRDNGDPEIHLSRRRIGAVVESPAVYGDMTAEDNLKMQYRILGLPSEEGLREIEVGRLFDRYYTVDAARRSTGLGLAVARTLTERMGGDISAELDGGVLRICVSFPCDGRPEKE